MTMKVFCSDCFGILGGGERATGYSPKTRKNAFGFLVFLFLISSFIYPMTKEFEFSSCEPTKVDSSARGQRWGVQYTCVVGNTVHGEHRGGEGRRQESAWFTPSRCRLVSPWIWKVT